MGSKEQQKSDAVEKKKRGRPKKTDQKTANGNQQKKVEHVEAEKISGKKSAKNGYGVNGNLVSMADLTASEQRKICSAGGVASGEARRRKKAIRDMLCDFLDQEANPIIKANMQKLGINSEDLTNMMAMFASVFSKAVNHQDINALRTIMEYAGRAPLQEMRENEAIAKMSQAMQLAASNNSSDENEDDDDIDVIFYIPQNGRPIITDEEMVTVDVD